MMFIFAPAIGDGFFFALVILQSVAAKTSENQAMHLPDSDASIGLFPLYIASLPVAYAFGILPSLFGQWLYISVSKHIDSFIGRLTIAPVAGVLVSMLFLLPIYPFQGGSQVSGDQAFSILIASGMFSAFVSVLIFDNPFLGRRNTMGK